VKRYQYRTLPVSNRWDLSQHPTHLATDHRNLESPMNPLQMHVLESLKSLGGRMRLAGILAAAIASVHLPSASQTVGSSGQAAQNYACRVFYLPARAVWIRELTVEHTDAAVVRIRIDGVPSHGFSHEGTMLSTHLDNERIQVDLKSGQWRSEFRDRAEGDGVCVRKSAR
jgi:hypothetical protein